MRAIKITRPKVNEKGGYYLDAYNMNNILGEISVMLMDEEPGEVLQIELVDLDMSKEMFDNLPEFMGW
jgi:hypothetical protein